MAEMSFDPEKARRLRELVSESERINAQDEIGEADVRRLEGMLHEASEIADGVPGPRVFSEDGRAELVTDPRTGDRRWWHVGQGRAIDFPPTRDERR